MLALLSPRKLPPIPTGPKAPAADSKLTESPEELSPPRPLDGSNYPATPSLTSSDASIASTDPQTTPPNTAEQGRLPAGGTDRGRKHPREPNSPLRNSLTPPSTPIPAPRKESTSPSTPEQPRSRPPRPPLPPVLGGPDPNDAINHTHDGISIVSRTTYFTQRSVAAKPRTRTTSTFLRDCHDSWVYVLCSRPKVLAGLLQYIDFAEFHALCCTSKPMRDILDIDTAVRDVILSRFVPGYRSGAMPAGHQDIRVDLRDLEALSEYMIFPRSSLPFRYAVRVFTRTSMAYSWLGLFRALVPCIARGSVWPSNADATLPSLCCPQCYLRRFPFTSTRNTPWTSSPAYPHQSRPDNCSILPTCIRDSSSSCAPELPPGRFFQTSQMTQSGDSVLLRTNGPISGN